MASSRLPREHGFWVMLVAVLASAVARSVGSPGAWIAAGGLLVVVAVTGGLVRKRIRRDSRLQLVAASLLSFLGVPVGLVGGEPTAGIAATTVAWLSVNLAGALVVRGVLSGARSGAGAARLWGGLAVGLCAASGTGLWAAGSRSGAAAAFVAAGTSATVTLLAPRPARLRRVGLSLALVATVAAVLLVL